MERSARHTNESLQGESAEQPAAAEQRPRVQSVARASAILSAIASDESGLHPREVSKKLGLSRPATYHLLHTLAQVGLVSRSAEGRYVLGLRVGILAESFKRQLAEGPQLSALLRDVARQSGETVSAIKWSNGEAIVIDVVSGSHHIQAVQVPHGFADAAYSRAGGKMMLATASDLQRQEYFAKHDLIKRTPHTVETIAELEQQFERIRKAGYSIEKEEFAAGVSCIAYPVGGLASPYALVVSAPSDRFEREWESYLAILASTVSAYFVG